MIVDFSAPGTSFLHRHDPRAKLAALTVSLPPFFLPGPWWLPLVYAAAFAVVVAVALGIRELRGSLKAIAPVLLVIVLLTPVFRRDGAVLLAVGRLSLVTDLGLQDAARIAGRFTGLTLVFFAAFRTMDMDELVLALRWYGLPYRPALTLSAAFRFVPTLFALSQTVQDAHALRRAGEGRVGFFSRMMPQLTSVVILAVRMIPSLAMALETRGLGRLAPRTQWRVLDRRGLAASWCATLLLALVLYAPFVVLLLS